MSNSKLIEDLSREYDELQEELERVKKEVRAKHRAAERQEFSEVKEGLERAFAVKFNAARDLGVKRYELELPVLKTKDGRRFKYFVELGGGELSRLKTVEERLEIAHSSRVEEFRRVLDELGIFTVPQSDDGEPTRYVREATGTQFHLDMWGDRLVAVPADGEWQEVRAFQKDNTALFERLYELQGALARGAEA